MADALRADYLGAYGFQGEVSPNLDRLAVESILFENCFSQAPWTKPSIASLFTGLYPLAHGLTDHLGKFWSGDSPELRTGVLAEQAVTMAEAFQADGYRTAAFVGNSWMGPAFGFDQGFESYEMPGKTRVSLDKARAWLDSLPPDAPFFLYLHLMDVHAPYYGREKDYRALRQSASLGPDRRLTENEYQQLASNVRRTRWAIPEDQEWLNAWKAKYAASVRNLDREIAPFLEYLRLNEIMDESVVVLTSDHGEEFLEHGFWTHGADLCHHQLHVPLWIRRPEADGAGRRVSSVVGLVDMMPTLLAMASIDPPPLLQGNDFSSLLLSEDAVSSSEVSFATAATHAPALHAAHDGRYRLLWQIDTDQLRLFRRDSGPDAVGDISDQEPMVVERLRSLLAEHLERVSARGPLSRETAPMTKEIEERLKSLGYLQ
jgi:arylsulfatase A-like enzyme